MLPIGSHFFFCWTVSQKQVLPGHMGVGYRSLSKCDSPPAWGHMGRVHTC